ncbi:MAG: DNA alkylation repair protein [Tetrasphaera sp.]
MSTDIVAAVRAALRSAGDPERAIQQQRYMKSAMPYRGLTSRELKLLLRPVLAAYAPAERTEWEHAVRELFDDAAFREERYAAAALAQHRSARAWQDPAAMGLYRHLVVTGAWWDHVDDLATHSVAPILLRHRDSETERMLDWAVADDLWLRRVAIICQLPFGDRTDIALLGAVIDANVEGTAYGREFFVRKAIGWALRQYARINPDWVRAFVAERADVLSGLSTREALKHLA